MPASKTALVYETSGFVDHLERKVSQMIRFRYYSAEAYPETEDGHGGGREADQGGP